jgi:two-component system phosphate regulon response regulator PhoB
MKEKILVVDDEPDVLELVQYNLTKAGFQVRTVSDGAEAVKQVREAPPDLIVLDLMMPEIDGIEVCKLIRADPRTSGILILMLTARASEMDRVLGLEVGADDYLTKPFSPRELVIRIRNLLGRQESIRKKDVIQAGNLCIEVSKHDVTVKGKRIDLTATEFNLLTVLAQRSGRVQSREQLLRDVWEYDSLIDTRTVDTHVRRLRHKLGAAAKHIETVRSIGYRFLEE